MCRNCRCCKKCVADELRCVESREDCGLCSCRASSLLSTFSSLQTVWNWFYRGKLTTCLRWRIDLNVSVLKSKAVTTQGIVNLLGRFQRLPRQFLRLLHVRSTSTKSQSILQVSSFPERPRWRNGPRETEVTTTRSKGRVMTRKRLNFVVPSAEYPPWNTLLFKLSYLLCFILLLLRPGPCYGWTSTSAWSFIQNCRWNHCHMWC